MWRSCLAPLFADHPLCSWQRAQSQPFLTLNLWVSQHGGHKQQFNAIQIMTIYDLYSSAMSTKETNAVPNKRHAGREVWDSSCSGTNRGQCASASQKRNAWTSPFPENTGNTMPYQQDLWKNGAGDMLSYLSSYCVDVFRCRSYKQPFFSLSSNKWSVLNMQNLLLLAIFEHIQDRCWWTDYERQLYIAAN